MYYLYFSFLDEGTASHLYILNDHQETTNNFSLKSKWNYNCARIDGRDEIFF